ncbi:MAG: winged helix-turn-helix domain-containing protein [Thermomicrobiales bacterium]
MERYAIRSRILASLDESKVLSELADDIGVTDSRLLWHLRQMRDDGLLESGDEVRWSRSEERLLAPESSRTIRTSSVFSDRVVDDFNDAMGEAADGLYGASYTQAGGEHRSRLSTEQAEEFRDRLVSLIEEYFAPGQGDRTGIKHGFHWVLTPIDLHPSDDE